VIDLTEEEPTIKRIPREVKEKLHIRALPKDILRLIHDFVVAQRKRKFLIALGMLPSHDPTDSLVQDAEASVRDQSPWVAIFRRFEWLEVMVKEYDATPLLIGNILDPETIKNPPNTPNTWLDERPYLVLYLGAKTLLTREHWHLFIHCLRDRKVENLPNQHIRLFSNTVLNVGNLFNSQSEEPTLRFKHSNLASNILITPGAADPKYSFFETHAISDIKEWGGPDRNVLRLKFSPTDPIQSICCKEDRYLMFVYFESRWDRTELTKRSDLPEIPRY
jgi:hypothetical protein